MTTKHFQMPIFSFFPFMLALLFSLATSMAQADETPTPTPSPTPTPCSNQVTTSDIPARGIVAGVHTDTHESDNSYQSIVELNIIVPNSYHLEHKWTFTVPDATAHTFYLEAFRSTTEETLQFSYSMNDADYILMFGLAGPASDPNSYETFTLPPGIAGTLYVRVRSSNPSDLIQTTLNVDQMFLLSTVCPTPTPTPTPTPSPTPTATPCPFVPGPTPYPDLTPLPTPQATLDISLPAGVDWTVSGSIQSTVNSAASGDRILLDGTSYVETVTVTNKTLWIEDNNGGPSIWTGATPTGTFPQASNGQAPLIVGTGGVVILKNLSLRGGNSYPTSYYILGQFWDISWGGQAGHGLEVRDGGLAYLIDCESKGGTGGSGGGSHWLSCSSPAGSAGGNGGAGIYINNANAYVDRQSLLRSGGAGTGWGGFLFSGGGPEPCCQPQASNGTAGLPLSSTPVGVTQFQWVDFSITEPTPTPFDDSLLVSHNIPAIAGGETDFQFSITLTNSGNTAWTTANGFKLAEITDSCGVFTPNEIALPSGLDVPPGSEATFIGSFTAPAAPTTCTLQFQMTHNGSPFGAIAGATLDIQAAVNDAQVMDESIPDTMTTNQSLLYGVRMTNNGTTQWSADGAFQFTVLDDPCGIIGNAPLVPETPVNPNRNYYFPLYLAAPATTGPCAIQLQMEEIAPGPIRANADPGLFGEVFTATIQIEEPVNAIRDWSRYE